MYNNNAKSREEKLITVVIYISLCVTVNVYVCVRVCVCMCMNSLFYKIYFTFSTRVISTRKNIF